MTSLIAEIFRCNDAKIIEVILENYREDLSLVEISEMSDVFIGDVEQYLQHLKKLGVIERNLIKEEKGQTFKWRLNKDNIYSKALILFEGFLVTELLDKKIKEEKYERSI